MIITGGGTGGHVYPALSIADKIKEQHPEAEIQFIGTKRGLEADVVPNAGYDFKAIQVAGFRRKLSLDTLKSFYLMFKGFFQAGKLIKTFKPDLLIGTGGYVAGPVMLQGALKNTKTIIHEQNAIPGVTVKLLAPFMDKVCVSYEESNGYFKKQEKLVLTGNPVRDKFSSLDRDACRQKLKLDHPTLLCVGGSGGAKAINDGVLELITKYNKTDMHLIHITGKRYYKDFMSQVDGLGIDLGSNIQILDYAYNMPEYMVAADMILSRAGALILAEIAVVGLPSILIPSPFVAHDHQTHNANVYEKNGAGIMLDQKTMEPGQLGDIVEGHLFNSQHLETMRTNTLHLAKVDATQAIYNQAMEIL